MPTSPPVREAGREHYCGCCVIKPRVPQFPLPEAGQAPSLRRVLAVRAESPAARWSHSSAALPSLPDLPAMVGATLPQCWGFGQGGME